MNKEEKVSIILPAYKAEGTIRSSYKIRIKSNLSKYRTYSNRKWNKRYNRTNM